MTVENKTLYERLVSMQDRERRHVSQELHDELGPCLFGIRGWMSLLSGRDPLTPSDWRMEVVSAYRMVQEGLTNIARQ